MCPEGNEWLSLPSGRVRLMECFRPWVRMYIETIEVALISKRSVVLYLAFFPAIASDMFIAVGT